MPQPARPGTPARLVVTPKPPFFVLSGGPCAGKSTLIDELESRGYRTVREASTDLIESPDRVLVPGFEERPLLHREMRQLAPLAFQRAVLQLQLERESRITESCVSGSRVSGSRVSGSRVSAGQPGDSDGPIFVDRGIGDHFGYLRLVDLRPFPELLEAWTDALSRYQAILFCELSPSYSPAAHRDEDVEAARATHELLRCEYAARHPRLISIPWLPLPERVDALLGIVADVTRERDVASRPSNIAAPQNEE